MVIIAYLADTGRGTPKKNRGGRESFSGEVTRVVYSDEVQLFAREAVDRCVQRVFVVLFLVSSFLRGAFLEESRGMFQER